jgi:hypothetical protein
VRRTSLLASLLLGACASTPTAGSDASGPRAADYAPLEVGASWTYKMNFQGQQGEQTVEVLSKTDDGYFRDNQQGELRHVNDGLRDRARYLIQEPLAPGQTWKAIVSASAVERYRIDSVGERCSAAAGSFDDCLVVTSEIRRDENVTLHARFTWAKGVGLVKMETEAEIQGKRTPQTKRSLLRYSLASDAAASGGQEEEGAPDDWER